VSSTPPAERHADDASAAYRRYLSAVVLHGQASAEAIGLNATDMYALNLLDLEGPLTSGELADRTGLTTGATTRLIDRLERSGHVRRRADPTDRRKVVVEPAEPGPQTLEALAPARRRIGEIFGDFTAGERATLFAYFDRAAEAYLAATKDLHAARKAKAGH
jgi:DNA-binding MarR family transcriptional regulator